MAVPFIPGHEETLLVDDHAVRRLSVHLETSVRDVTQTDILDFGASGFLLNDVLTPRECSTIIEEGERMGFEEIAGVKKSYRNCTRIVLESQELAETLYQRVLPFLSDITITGDPHQCHIHGVGSLLQGRWTPSKLNQTFRLCRYQPGGHFAPHYDGHFVENAELRSMVTLMLYLNGDFTGGATSFVDDQQTLFQDENGRYCAEDKNILYRIQPQAGMAILFNHHRLHEGSALGSGVKYILRTDIMFRRCDGPTVPDSERQAILMVQEAERLEARGDNMAAMALYRKAFKLSPEVAKSYGN